MGASADGRPAGRLALWAAGKAATYAGLGLVAGTVGAAIGSPRLGTQPLAALAVGAGVLMVLLGFRGLWRQAVPARGGGEPISTLLGALLRRRGPWVPVVAGMLTGLLPCGLVYAMTAQALAAASPMWGAAIMLAFGLGTAPSLLGMGALSGLLRGRARRRGESLAAAAVVVMGCVVVWRGAQILLSQAGTVSSCH